MTTENPAKSTGENSGNKETQMRSVINSIDIEALKKMKLLQAMEAQKKADSQPSLTPEVKWAQNPEALSLQVSLTQIIKPDVKINGDTLEFSASGIGAAGERRNYEFELNFYDHVDKGFMVRVHPTAVQLIIRKDRESCYMWKTLIRGDKPKFLKIDTDRWIDPEDIKYRSPEEIEKMRQQHMSEREKLLEAKYKQVMFAEEMKFQAAEESREFTKRAYLFCYSLAMFAGYFFIISKLVYGAISLHQEYLNQSYISTANVINALHTFAFLEAVHCYFGFTGGKVGTVLLQCLGRASVCAYLNYHSRAQTSAFVFLLFFAWSMAEIIRYPYYMSTIVRKRMPRLEWTRYTAFLLLYPIGLIGELGVINATIFDITQPIVEMFQESSGDEPEEIVHHQEIGNFYYFLRLHQIILPFAVFFLMWKLFQKRGKALETGKLIDDRIKQEQEKMNQKMKEIEKKFIEKQISQMKSGEEKKDE